MSMRKFVAAVITIALMPLGLVLTAPTASAIDSAACGVLGGGAGHQGMVQVPVGETECRLTNLVELRSAISAGAKYLRIPGAVIIDIPNAANTLTIPSGAASIYVASRSPKTSAAVAFAYAVPPTNVQPLPSAIPSWLHAVFLAQSRNLPPPSCTRPRWLAPSEFAFSSAVPRRCVRAFAGE